MSREQRRLAAIVAADVVGYSRLMGRDESGTLSALKAVRRDIVDPRIAAHRGRIVKTTGDGLLLEFASVVDAVRCVIDVQEAMRASGADIPEDRRIAFRIGVNLGDIISEGDDIFGDGVNVAARLQEIAPPGGVCVSSRVHDDVRDRLDVAFEDDGERTLKNIARPVRVWRWEPGAIGQVGPSITNAPLALPDKPSIAVLPFQNMSGDPNQDYFADGMVEEIITALSRTRALFVIARNSSFAYKGKSPDIRQVGRELGVRYVLEGSVRVAGNRLRITGQLIDAATGAHIWADRIDGGLEDIFELQDAVSSRIAGAISPALEQAEIARARRKVGNLQAYDYYLQGLASFYRFTREDVAESLGLLRKAVELDPEFAAAYAASAHCYVARRSMACNEDRDVAEAERVSRLALSLDRNDARTLALCGHALRYVVGRTEEGFALLDQAVRLDPNLAMAWAWRGAARNSVGQPELAIEDLERALRLSPLDPLIFVPHGQMANAHYLCGRYDDATSWAKRSLQSFPNHPTAMRALMAAHAMAGRHEAARRACADYLKLDPAARLSSIRRSRVTDSDEVLAKFERGLRAAGLPE